MSKISEITALFSFEPHLQLSKRELQKGGISKVTELIDKNYLREIIDQNPTCPEEGCHNTAEFIKISDTWYLLDRIARHMTKVHLEDWTNYEVEYREVCKSFLEYFFPEKKFQLMKSINYFLYNNEDTIYLVFPGKSKKRKITEFLELIFRNSDKDFAVFNFDEKLNEEIRNIINMFGVRSCGTYYCNSSFSNKRWKQIPKEYKRRRALLETFRGMESISQNKIDSYTLETVKKMQQNPRYLLNELIDSYRINNSERFEDIVKLALGYLFPFDINNFGQKETGERVPDGIGVMDINSNGTFDPKMVVLDTKSLKTFERDHINLNFYENQKYEKYLKDAEKISKLYNIQKIILIFLAPKFNENQALELAKNIRDSGKIRRYDICFLELYGLVLLLLTKIDFNIQWEAKMKIDPLDALIYKIFDKDSFFEMMNEKSEANKNFFQYNSFLVQQNDVKCILLDFLKDEPSRKEILDAVCSYVIPKNTQ